MRRFQVMTMRTLCTATALALLAGGAAQAQDAYPARPIQVIVPATAGGPADTAIRMIEARMSTALNTPLVLVNRPGASGIVGMSAVATAPADGYVIGAGVNSIFTVVHISGSSVPFTLDNFAVIGNYATDVSVLCVNAEAPWQTFQELIDHARKSPGKLTYGSAGIGTVSSLSMESIKHAFKLDITAVPFPGGAQLTMAVLGKHVDIGMVPYSTGAALLREKKLRPLVTTAPKRLPPLADVPTIGEVGLSAKGFNLVLGLFAPKGTPDSALKVLVNALDETMKDPAVEAKFQTIGLFTQYENPALAHQRLTSEYKDVLEVGRQLKEAK
jgi:tripartite-type tricarboxylate transporter receptor subunit TctC